MNGRDWRKLYASDLVGILSHAKSIFPHAVGVFKMALEVFGWLSLTTAQVTSEVINLAIAVSQILDVLQPQVAPDARDEKKLHFHMAVKHCAERLIETRTPWGVSEEGAFERDLRAHDKNGLKAGRAAAELKRVAQRGQLRHTATDLYLQHRAQVATGRAARINRVGTIIFLPCCLALERDVKSMRWRLHTQVTPFDVCFFHIF